MIKQTYAQPVIISAISVTIILVGYIFLRGSFTPGAIALYTGLFVLIGAAFAVSLAVASSNSKKISDEIHNLEAFIENDCYEPAGYSQGHFKPKNPNQLSSKSSSSLP